MTEKKRTSNLFQRMEKRMQTYEKQLEEKEKRIAACEKRLEENDKQFVSIRLQLDEKEREIFMLKGEKQLEDPSPQVDHREVMEAFAELERKTSDSNKLTYIHQLCTDNKGDLVIQMIKINNSIYHLRDNEGDTILHWAAFYINMQCLLRFLLKGKAIPINTRNYDGYAALHWAAERDHPQAVNILLENDCDIKIKNNEGKTALDIAKTRNRRDIVRLLEKAR